jgi:hypothetical protein
MKKELSAIEAKYEAQKIAFGPMYFQSVLALRDLGILQYISENRKGVTVANIIENVNVSEYGVTLLLEAAEILGVVEMENDIVKISKIGFFSVEGRNDAREHEFHEGRVLPGRQPYDRKHRQRQAGRVERAR